MLMEVDFATSDLLDQEIIDFEDANDDSNFDGERCGICMDIIIDRGVLDCCQHWFCFGCIDNWATITNLCPLCQNEFQLITCVPVYDTVGNNKVDDDSSSRDDEWSIEGKNNTLSFPSYYIDENAVICLDGDGCKIRSGSVNIEDGSNLDTSIACDSCDIWYHAFCVGFDTENTTEDTWLCPRCMVGEIPKKSDATSIQRPSHLSGLDSGHTSCLPEAIFSGKLSVAVADAGETAVVVSMVNGNKEHDEATETACEVDKDLKVDGNSLLAVMLPYENSTVEPGLGLQLPLLHNTSSSQPACFLTNELETNPVDGSDIQLSSSDVKSSLRKLLHESNAVDRPNDLGTEEQGTDDVPQKMVCEESLLRDEKVLPDAKKEAVKRIGSKRSRMNRSDDDVLKTAADEEDSIKNEAAASQKKLKSKGKFQMTRSVDRSNEIIQDDSRRRATQMVVPRDGKSKRSSEKEDAVPDIMSIVQGIGRSPKGILTQNSGDKSSKEKEITAGLRVKKIMRRATEDESSGVVQKLRKEIREAVRNRSSIDIGENLFDPKLLAAFRTAVAGPPTTEVSGKLSPSAVKAKKLLLQKGKVRENLTKKIYGNSNGRRRRAWDRECEVEFWKHRCMKASKPEKIATLKSVLNLLRKNNEGFETEHTSESQSKNQILSRLYLADTSVFPRKNDIKPVSALSATNNSEQNSRELNSLEKAPNSSQDGHALESTEIKAVSLNLVVPSVHDKGSNNKLQSSKGKGTSSNANHGSSQASLGGVKVKSQKETGIQSDKIDKRKWAMEVLARKKAATSTQAMPEKEEDNAILKGNYPLLAQLPIDMRPVLGQSRHNKIPLSVRQAQLYRLTELFLKKLDVPEVRRSAETELAVADAINIEKGVADRSSSKLVYLNLCSQELLHRSDNSSTVRTTESSSSSSLLQPNQSEQANEELSSDTVIQEALKNAGLISDSPPSSPCNTEKANEVVNSPLQNKEDGPDNIFEMDSHPGDIYGDFEYDIEDEDYIGATAMKVANVPSEESESKLKVVFSALKSEKSSDQEFKDHERLLDDMEEIKLPLKVHTNTGSSPTTEHGMVKSSDRLNLLATEDGGELSLAECEELYGPDKEPLLDKLPEETCELFVNSSVPTKGNVSSQVSRENSSNPSRTSENFPRMDESDSTNPVSKKVEMYIKEHIRPLCKSGVISTEQYRWAVSKTTEKVMKYHQNAKNAHFLIKEGEKVKKLAEQYLETAPQKGKSDFR